MPKNRPKNSFFFFMQEIKEEHAARGIVVTMKTLPDLCHPKWARLSRVERQPYEEMARKYKNDPNLRGGKLASDGTRVEDNLREIEEMERRENMMIAEIRRYLNIGCIADNMFKDFALRKMFYFISFNILCKTEDEYIPIEVGIAEYSILHGIHREFHRIIFPGHIPTGYAGEAKRLSEDKHGLDIYFPAEHSERNMTDLFNMVKRFVNPQDLDDLPPLFCSEEDIMLVRGCLEWLSSRARRENEFDVWNTKYLLLELRAGIGFAIPSLSLADDLLSKTAFNYTPAARCEFHDEKDNHNCALAYSKRLCYLISDAVSEQFGVELTENHIPSRYQENSGYVVTMYNNPSRKKRGPAAPSSVRLDQRSNYYQNEVVEEEEYGAAAAAPPPAYVPVVQPNVPRQPATDCIAAQMARLKLNMTAAAVPGLGIGRGQRRNN